MPWLVTVFLLANSCATNPVSKRKQLVFMSEKQEIAIGKDADPQIIAEYGLYEDKALQEFINQKGKEMAGISHRPNLEYNFRVVDSDILNAFAIPGGYVYFTRGIMAHFNNEAEFTGVLGHEIGHITARHSVQQQRNQILGQVGILAGVVLAPQLAQLAEPASQGLGLLFLKFSRDDESQADKLGAEYSSRIGYDASQMAEFFHTLERESAISGAGEIPEFLSTHPNPKNRFTAVSKEAKKWKEKLGLTNPQVNRNAYLKRIDGIVYGEDPRQGYLENSVFYHPGLKFQVDVPGGWQYQNTPAQVQLASADGKALMIITSGKGNSTTEAAKVFLQQNGLQAVSTKETNVNGLKALAIIADQKPQEGQQPQTVLRTLSYFIQYGESIYLVLGAAARGDFDRFANVFTASQQSFKELTNSEKINKKPERVRIKNITSTTSLEQALRSYNMEPKRLEELAILNGMQLGDKIEPGTLIKIVER